MKRRWSSKRLKYKLANRLIYSPFLRLLIFKVWFRLGVLAFAALLVFLALFLPRIWTVSPADFRPVVKVSGLDLAQAWSLKRSATRAMTAGRFDDAAFSWRAAMANQPADPELIRGALRNFLRVSEPKKHLPLALGRGLVLLQLTHTNVADLELVAEVSLRHRFYATLEPWLASRQQSLTPTLEAAYLKVLFHQGKMAEFARRWDATRGKALQDPELPLYRAAYEAGWLATGEGSEALRTLDEGLRDSGRRLVCTRLLLWVSARRGDARRYEELLHRLEARDEDSLWEHLGYWKVLAAQQRRDQAVAAARACTRRPENAVEAVAFAETCEELGLRDHALQIFSQHADELGQAVEFWITYGNLLLAAERWPELRDVALQMRQRQSSNAVLAGLGHIFEGYAEHALGRRTAAEEAFHKALRCRFDNRLVVVSTGSALLRMGYPAVARELFGKLESEVADDPRYWELLCQAAEESRHAETLARAAARLVALRPNDPVALHWQAVALLLARERPADTIRLTLQVLLQRPDSVAVKINHSFALVLNQRVEEAAALLRTIKAERLSGKEAASYHAAWFEVLFALQRYEEAWRESERIDMGQLFPAQTNRLAELKRQAFQQAVRRK